jgi:ComF family protein
LINLAREAFASVLEIVYPMYCGGCGRQGDVLCDACRESFIAIDTGGVCPVCGRWIGKRLKCGECISHPKYFEQAYYGFSFEGPAREAMHAFKFEGRKDVGRAMVRACEEKIRSFSSDFDLIVPLPVTERRLKKRGFNQSFIISEEISRITGTTINYWSLAKVKETQDQYTLSKEERKRNIKGVFETRKNTGMKGKRILLVDDLYTTGSTVQEASKALLRVKPETILVFALARTPE